MILPCRDGRPLDILMVACFVCFVCSIAVLQDNGQAYDSLNHINSVNPIVLLSSERT